MKLLALAAIAATAVAGCASDTDESASATGTATGDQRTLTVFAAASLKATFTDLEKTFEAENPGVDVMLSFAGSSSLASQINDGAPADVFASADEPNMAKVVDAGNADTPTNFASNTLTVVTQPGNPKKVTGLNSSLSSVALVICAKPVPCGTATATLAEKAKVTLTPRSEESNVSDVLAKVTNGQADAGVVYVTDAKVAGDKVTAVPIANAADATTRLQIARVKESKNPELADSWISLVTGADGKKALADRGFQE